MKIQEVFWFTEATCSLPIGVVIGTNDVGERKAYIGISLGSTEEIDTQHIVEYGAPLYVLTVERILKAMKGE